MRKILLSLLLIIFCATSFSQAICGFDQKMKQLIATDPKYAQDIILNEQKIRDYIAAHPQGRPGSTTAVITIPVVVHVLHTGGAVGSIYNPTDAVIQGAISYLNQVYAGTYAGMEVPVGGASVVNLEINFVLAQRTASCGYTNGIDRVNASSLPNYTSNGINFQLTTGCPEATVKDFARWNPADYYNIYVVNKIDGADGTVGQFWAGYATFPGSSPSTLDGTVMLATQMATGKKTLPHEIGHAFNLYHPFQGSTLSTNCPVNTTCSTDGDAICDTDPISYNVNGSGVFDFTCRTGTNTCTGTAYTKNTEHNFMNYTSCYTLFTDGQKARVQAATSLGSRISLANSLAGTSCGTSINFVTGTDIKTENNAGTVIDCRKYTDYTYQMTIGAAPAASVIATLNFSGTATKGLDYEVTTNGNFVSPGNTLTFAGGSTTAQTFTVRIFDDAAIETAETAIFNFTLNNSNATVGTTIPTFTLTINDNEAAPVAGATLSAGVGTYNINLNQPLRSSNFDARTQVLYTASELNALGFTAGNITSIGFNVVTKGSTQPFNGFTIKLKNTLTAALAFGAFETGATPVYGPVAFSTTGTVLHTIPITPFLWDGTSNLLVDICFDNTTASGDDVVRGSTSTANTFYEKQVTNATSGCSIVNNAFSFTTASRPIFIFGITTTPAVISTALSSSKTSYLGPNEDVYFYDASGNILARIKNLTAFDYGCTQIVIDRAGTTSAQFWNSTTANYLASKSFKVIPTNNTAAGHYQITLYYSAAEVTGWQTATGQVWANAKMVKVSNGFYIPDVSAASPHIIDVSAMTATPTTFGSNYTITGDFNTTGFSGFGVGVPGTAACPTINVTNPATATGTANTGFSQTFTQTGAVGGANFTVNSGTLPAGLSLSIAGLLSGTPTQTGSFPLTIKVTDGNSCTGIGATYTLVIGCQTITVTNPSTTTGTAGSAFSQTFTQTGGIGTSNFTLNSGTLPAGLSLTAGTGILSGTPTQGGTFPVTIKSTDGNGCTGTGATYNLVISCPTITVTNPATATGTANAAFSQTFTQTGAVGGATFSLNTGTLPTGLTLSAAGVLSGTPTQTGSFPITVKVSGGGSCIGLGGTYTLVIGCQTITVTNPATLTGTSGTAFSQTFTQTGGIGTSNFTLNSGTLPTGLSLAAGTGILSGTPTKAVHSRSR